ncbi:hypothetical protein C8J23_101157 [Shewanella chilikensis]|uniref:Uncharacterized protein n=1 Tax=Shewanella chilikensis TaxID=558541 RepID=A0ABX5PT94_9GAMM|nr:hypothetical protein [Shewanella chilikensis]MCL1154818.1 hypothetical protein [Shewanella chilikensis]PYE61115.1 hypothetical protein C8J23_101157 [Shewanella chilikensis]GGZ31594.1 hypothetical protein GCM10007105_18810 [Shewanella chilikensis]
MTKILNTVVLTEPVRYVGLLVVDTDQYANRIVAYEHDDPTIIIINSPLLSNPYKTVLPVKYATTAKMFVGILDDDGEYDCKFTDGVLAQLVNPAL